MRQADVNNNSHIKWNFKTDVWWDDCLVGMSEHCEPVWVDAEDPLFILYTRQVGSLVWIVPLAN